MMARRYRNSRFAFGTAPLIKHSRSQFDLSYSHKTSFNAGKLIPVYCQEILPGDSFSCETNVVVRVTSSFLKPVMDNAFMDVYFFYVPNRLVFDQWEQIFGENKQSSWVQSESVSSPLITTSDSDDVEAYVGTIADYLGIHPQVQQSQNIPSLYGGISVLPFRAYAKIWDDWFRDENLQDPMLIQTGSDTSNESFDVVGSAWSPSNYMGSPAPINKTHDYFTQVLPSPQKGSAVSIGSAVIPQQNIPVYTSSSPQVTGVHPALSFSNQYGNVPIPGPMVMSTGGVIGSNAGTGTAVDTLYPNNLYANFPETSLGAVDVNDLRYAFQLQKMLERDARSGTRYREYLLSAFGVSSPDSRLQVSEFLGGKRIPLSIFQTTQTSQATEDSPLGNVAAFSLTNGRSKWSKSFVEHGFVIGVAAIRYFHTYQQGTEKFWFRTNRTDFYDSVFANIGEQPVYTKQLYSGTDITSETVFGYNPAWEDYRCRMNRISGQLRTVAGEGLDIWHFADDYSSAPVLGSDWIEETPSNIDRTLSVPSSTVNQFIVDFYFKQKAVRAMPTYSVPGFIDHH